MGSCGWGGLRTVHFKLTRSTWPWGPVLQSPAPSVCMLKRSWPRHWTLFPCVVCSTRLQTKTWTNSAWESDDHSPPASPTSALFLSFVAAVWKYKKAQTTFHAIYKGLTCFVFFTSVWIIFILCCLLILFFSATRPSAFKCLSSAFPFHLCLTCCCFCFPTLRQQHFRSNGGCNRPAVEQVQVALCCTRHSTLQHVIHAHFLFA